MCIDEETSVINGRSLPRLEKKSQTHENEKRGKNGCEFSAREPTTARQQWSHNMKNSCGSHLQPSNLVSFH